jgi:RNA polymerase sigma factor (sigma-70 family)
MWDVEADRALLEGIRANNEEALLTFDRRFRGPLLSVARKRGLSVHDAEDAVQETLLAAIAQIRDGRFEGRCSLGAWIGTIFRNHVYDAFRKGARDAKAFVSLEASESAGALAMHADRTLPTELDHTRTCVRECLAALPARERLVLLLNVQHGLRAREIAPLLRLGTKLTESILTAAKKRFREHLAESENRGPRRLQE